MTDVLQSVQNLLKLESVSTDNTIFRMHYKVTTTLLVTMSLLVTQKQYIGDPIDCIQESISESIMDTYCWIHSTFTIPNLTGIVGEHIPHPGVANPILHGPDELYETKQHKYYQWVTLVLYLQAIMFYAGRYLWKSWEGGKVKMLLMDLNKPDFSFNEDEDEEDRKEPPSSEYPNLLNTDDGEKKYPDKMPSEYQNLLEQVDCSKNSLKKIFKKSVDEPTSNLIEYFDKNWGRCNMYFWKFFFCELINLANVIGQIFFTNRFLGNAFLSYGSQVVEMSNQEIGTRNDPMDEVFPKVAKCTFHRYGASGTLEKLDGLCVLPINILNEKIYIILWFWFIILSVMTGLHLLYRFSTIVFPEVRCHLLQMRGELTPPEQLQFINRRCSLGDWFTIYQLGKNMDPFRFNQFLQNLYSSMVENSLGHTKAPMTNG